MASFTNTTRILQDFSFLCKLGLLLSNGLTGINKFKYERKNKMNSGLSSKRRHNANGLFTSFAYTIMHLFKCQNFA